jgi:DnaJ-class molecular chaperone with C-terminal Zn finger domain
MSKCQLTSDGGGISVKTPYDPGFVADLKSTIPYTDRRYKPETKTWIVTPSYGTTLQDLCNKYFGEMPLLPTGLNVSPAITQKILDVRYIGQTKDRGTDERSAYGWHANGWNVIFPESVLRGWFDAPSYPDEQPNLYSVLACSRTATDDEIKGAYRRMVKQWHPDHSKEPNAHEQFLTIQHAYEVLTRNRERYDVGLAFEMSLRNTPKTDNQYSVSNGYRSPLRCGLIMCEGIESMGLFTVSKIFAWEDVKDSYGRTLVSSWPKGADAFEEIWV